MSDKLPSLREIEMRLYGYSLTTAEITYRLPDFPTILQQYIWQELDIAPKFPVLKKFLDFWEAKLDGKLHHVRVAHTTLIRPVDFRFHAKEFNLTNTRHLIN